MSQIKIRWQVEDGYAGGARPQHATITDDDLSDCDSELEVRELVGGAVESDFENKVAFGWAKVDEDKAVEMWRKMQSNT